MMSKKVPELRFKGFTDDWEERKLGNYIIQYSEKTKQNNQYPVLTSSRNGLFFQKDYYKGNQIASEDNTGYNIVPRGYFTYRHMSDDLVFKFNINDIADYGIVSTLYPVFTTNEQLDSKYLQYQLNEGSEFKHFSLLQKQGGSRTYMYLNKLQNMILTIPKLEEQQKIGSFFKHLDDTIALYQRKLDLLKEQKKGFLQKMFPKNGEKVPELRFAGFADAWEQRKLESLCEVFTDGDWIEAKDQSNSGVRLIQTGNIGITEYLDKENNKKWISEETLKRLRCEEVYPGDILISRLPDPAGRACILPNLGIRMITAVDCTIIRTSKEYDSKYLVQYLSTPTYFKIVNSFLGGGTRQRISRKNLSKIDIPVPHIFAEQQKIGEYFSNLDRLITLHQRKLDLLKEQKKGFLQKMFV